jgi:N4-gp56 family major capsid protein
MSRTIIGVNDAKAVKRYSAFLAVDTARISYFNKKFMGVGADSGLPIQMLPQLESDAGENISFDLSMQLRQQPIEGDDIQEGTEEDLKFYTDNVYIDQMRGGVDAGGRMTRKRTIHDLRRVARARQAEWWSRVFDELFFMYLSGSRGSNTDYIFNTAYTGFAGNAFAAPSASHYMIGGDAASYATIEATDLFDVALIDRAVAKAEMMGGGTQGVPQIQPIMIDGEEHYCCVMSPWQAYDLRIATGTSDWLEIQKSAATAEGRNSPIFKGGLGMHNGVVLHKHKGIIRFDDAGATTNLPAARALFMGEQAAVCAFGSPGTGLRFDWHEESRDNGNQLVISTSSIMGVKKTRFTIDGTATDFGVMALDTYSKDPNA